MIGSSLRCGQVKSFYSVFGLHNHSVIHTVACYKHRLGTRNYAKGDEPRDCKDCCKDIEQSSGRRVEPWPKPDSTPVPWRNECCTDPPPTNYDPYRIKVPDVMVPPLPPSKAKPMLECRGGSVCKPPPALPPPCPVKPPKPFNWIPLIVIGVVFTTVGLAYRVYVYYTDLISAGAYKPDWYPRPIIKRPRHDVDLPACVQYLIIGTGAAGWAGYQAIKEHDKTCKVFFISKEDCLPYKRLPMSKHMWWNSAPPDLKTLEYLSFGQRLTMLYAQCKAYLDPVRFYRKKRGPALGLATGWCVVRIDADEHVAWVKTNCGETPIYYERCLFAPGSKVRNLTALKSAPKKVREKTTTIRTIRDLEIAYRKVRDSKHVTIIGGGTLGTELAFYIGRMHKEMYPPLEGEELKNYVPPKVVHVFKRKGILSSIIPEYLGEWAAEKLRCENVQMIPNAEVYDAYESKDGRLELTLSNGEHIVTDFAIVAIGTAARTEIAKDSFLETDPVNGGYLVNTELMARTHLYIAGDAASFYSQWKDSRMRVEHFTTAEELGAVAGANMTGYWTPCNMEPEYWIRFEHDVEIQVIGEVGACMPTIGIFKPCEPLDPLQARYEKFLGEGQKPCYKDTSEWKNRYRRGILFYLRDDIVVGMVFWNFSPIEDRKAVVTELLRARVNYKEVGLLAELLGFKDLECVYVSAAFLNPLGPQCIENSKWLDPVSKKVAGKTLSEMDPSILAGSAMSVEPSAEEK